MLWGVWERRGRAEQDGFRSTHMKSDWTLWDPLAMDLNSTPSRSMSCGKHHSTMFPAETGGQVKTKSLRERAQHRTVQHTLLLGNALFDQTGPEPGGSSHPCPDELHQGARRGQWRDPIFSLKSVSFEWIPVAVPLPDLPLMALSIGRFYLFNFYVPISPSYILALLRYCF